MTQWRKTYRTDLLWQLPREIKFLECLSDYNGFPTILVPRMQTYLWLSHCGEGVVKVVKQGLSVEQVENQLATLLFTMVREGICHRDITTHNLLWHPERGLHLIDFGWSIWADEKDTPVPVPHVMRPWMCDHTDREQADETLEELRGIATEHRQRPAQV